MSLLVLLPTYTSTKFNWIEQNWFVCSNFCVELVVQMFAKMNNLYFIYSPWIDFIVWEKWDWGQADTHTSKWINYRMCLKPKESTFKRRSTTACFLCFGLVLFCLLMKVEKKKGIHSEIGKARDREWIHIVLHQECLICLEMYAVRHNLLIFVNNTHLWSNFCTVNRCFLV